MSVSSDVRTLRSVGLAAEDKVSATEVLRAVCLINNLDPTLVNARPKMAVHAIARRAVYFGLRSVGWSIKRARQASGITWAANRDPPRILVEVASRAARLAEERRRNREREAIRSLAENIVAAKTPIARARAIVESDSRGFPVATLARIVGVAPATICTWRRAIRGAEAATAAAC